MASLLDENVHDTPAVVMEAYLRASSTQHGPRFFDGTWSWASSTLSAHN